MKKKLLVVAILSILPFSIFAFGQSDKGYKKISQEEAYRLMNEEKVIILDVRTFEEFAAGHIQGAICVPNETISKDVEKEFPDKDATILVYCRSGNRSKQASTKLVKLGYTDIREFGGVNTWRYGLVK